jgi:hypothetical protein
MLDHAGSFAKDWPKIINPKRELVSFEWKKDGGKYTVNAATRIGGAVESVIVWTVDPAKAHLLNFHQYALFRQNDLRSIARVGMMFPLVEGF